MIAVLALALISVPMPTDRPPPPNRAKAPTATATNPRAQPEATLKRAIEDFEFGDHAVAAGKLEALLDPIRLSRLDDLVVARQYLGASYFLLGQEKDAEREFVLLLKARPTHRLDPLVFSPELVGFFDRLRPDRSAPIETQLGAEGPPAPPSRWMALVPFGGGQFANGHPIRGTLFATTEVALMGTALTTFLMFEDLKTNDAAGNVRFAPGDVDRAETLQTVYLAAFWAGMAVVATGILEAALSHPSERGSYSVRGSEPPALVRF